MWRIRMCALLVQQNLVQALKNVDDLPKGMNDEEKEDSIGQAHGVIYLC